MPFRGMLRLRCRHLPMLCLAARLSARFSGVLVAALPQEVLANGASCQIRQQATPAINRSATTEAPCLNFWHQAFSRQTDQRWRFQTYNPSEATEGHANPLVLGGVLLCELLALATLAATFCTNHGNYLAGKPAIWLFKAFQPKFRNIRSWVLFYVRSVCSVCVCVCAFLLSVVLCRGPIVCGGLCPVFFTDVTWLLR